MKHNDTRQLRGVEIGHDRPDIRITTLNPDDWEKLRDLKIQSLKEEPIAFENVDAGIAKYEQRTEQEWREALGGKLPDRAGERYMLFAMEDNRPVGMVEIIVPDSEDGELKLAIIQHMYVSKTHRGLGLGKKLFARLLSRYLKRKDIGLIRLQVVSSQIFAIKMYESFGFVESYRDEGIVLRGGEINDEIHMDLRPDHATRV